MAIQVAVIGASRAGRELLEDAELIGATLASGGATVVTGGLGGVMEAACRGAKSAGGLTIGFLPGTDRSEANKWVDVVVPTGMGEGRNILVVRSAQAVVAVGGEYGTLSEIALALRDGIAVIGLKTWSLTRGNGEPDYGILAVDHPVEAAQRALQVIPRSETGRGSCRRGIADAVHPLGACRPAPRGPSGIPLCDPREESRTPT